MRRYVGIDPGKNGAIVVIDDYDRSDYPIGVKMYPMPETPTAAIELFEDMKDMENDKYMIEKVQGYIGGKGEPGSAMFKFGFNYGMLMTAMAAMDIEPEEVQPQIWQRGVGVSPRKKGEAKAKFKNRLKAKAASLGLPLPKSLTLKTCDAVLIAWYCYQLNTKVRGRL